MGRKRSSRHDDRLPPRVYPGKSAFEWRPKGGGGVRLCSLDACTRDIWEAYEKAKAGHQRYTVEKLTNDFLSSPEFQDRAASTRDDYRNSSKKILAVFGHMEPHAVTMVQVRGYMDVRGKTSKVRANRERSFLMAVYTWAIQRNSSIKINPAFGVTPFKEVARKRYVTDQEYIAVYNIAPPMIQVAMDIAYLCAARQADVISIAWGRPGQMEPEKDQKAVILDHGIYIKQGKTDKEQVKLWSPALKAAVDHARKTNNARKVQSLYVISTKSATRYTSGGFKAVWKRVRDSALDEGLISESFTFHDLKAKGITDYEEGDKQEFSGHSSRQMMEKYNRGIQTVQALDSNKGK